MSYRALQQTIFAGCRDLEIDQDTRRDLQLRVTGKESLGQMSVAEMQLVVGELKRLGFRPKSGRRPAASRGDVRYIHVLWRILREAGKLDRPDRGGLNAFIRARFGDRWGTVPADVDMLRDPEQINAVVRALTDWCTRESLSLER